MLRPNFAMDAPPVVISVGGADYSVDTDYRTWLEVVRLLRDFIPGADTPAQQLHNAEAYERLMQLVFGCTLNDADPGEVLDGIARFAAGYPSAPMQPSGEPPTYSFEFDLNEIIIAIRNQSGIDLSYRRTEPFHWWEFLLEFRTLAGEHYILSLMELRGYKGDDKKMLDAKRRCALPVEHTAADQALMDEINAEFFGAV